MNRKFEEWYQSKEYDEFHRLFDGGEWKAAAYIVFQAGQRSGLIHAAIISDETLHIDDQPEYQQGCIDCANAIRKAAEQEELEPDEVRELQQRITELGKVKNECESWKADSLYHSKRAEKAEAEVKEYKEKIQSLRTENKFLRNKVKELEEFKASQIGLLEVTEMSLKTVTEENIRYREALEKAVDYIEEDGHSCEFYHNPEAGYCSFCEMMADLKQALNGDKESER